MAAKRAVFFCSANSGIDPKYNQAAQNVVRAACLAGYTIVSGGSWRGMMGTVCDTANECGAPNEGVLPEFMPGLEYAHLTKLDWTPDMASRKALMRKDTAFAIALPGGIGTMDEMLETAVLKKLGKYDGRVIIYNAYGFYEPLKAFIAHLVKEGMLKPEDAADMEFIDSEQEMLALFA